MSGRNLDPERVHRAHYGRLDSGRASAVMEREFRTAEPRNRSTTPIRMFVADERMFAQTRRELERSRLIPQAILTACTAGHAQAGEMCFSNGICGGRLRGTRS